MSLHQILTQLDKWIVLKYGIRGEKGEVFVLSGWCLIQSYAGQVLYGKDLKHFGFILYLTSYSKSKNIT